MNGFDEKKQKLGQANNESKAQKIKNNPKKYVLADSFQSSPLRGSNSELLSPTSLNNLGQNQSSISNQQSSQVQSKKSILQLETLKSEQKSKNSFLSSLKQSNFKSIISKFQGKKSDEKQKKKNRIMSLNEDEKSEDENNFQFSDYLAQRDNNDKWVNQTLNRPDIQQLNRDLLNYKDQIKDKRASIDKRAQNRGASINQISYDNLSEVSSLQPKDLASSLTLNSSVMNYRTSQSSQTNSRYSMDKADESKYSGTKISALHTKYASGVTASTSIRLQDIQKSLLNQQKLIGQALNKDIKQYMDQNTDKGTSSSKNSSSLQNKRSISNSEKESSRSDSVKNESELSSDDLNLKELLVFKNPICIDKSSHKESTPKISSSQQSHRGINNSSNLNFQFKVNNNNNNNHNTNSLHGILKKNTQKEENPYTNLPISIQIKEPDYNTQERKLEAQDKDQDDQSHTDESRIARRKRATRRKTITMKFLEEEALKDKQEQIKKNRMQTALKMVDIFKSTSRRASRVHNQRDGSPSPSQFNEQGSNYSRQQTNDLMNKSSVNSSFQGEKEGIPIRIHGKFKYINEIIRAKKDIKRLIIFRSLFAMIACTLLQIETEILVSQENVYNQKTFSMQCVITLVSFIEIYLLVRYYRDKVMLIKLRKDRLRQSMNIFLTKHRYTFLFDILVHLVMNPPGLNYKFTVKQLGIDVVYTWDMICACISLSRLHIIFELVPLFSVYTQAQSKRICNQTGAKSKTQFSWKALMKTYPYPFLALSIVVSVLAFGLTLRNLERYYFNFIYIIYLYRAKADRNGKFDYIWDSFWVIIIVMLTIGYGDITIDTNMGRLLGIISAFWGFLIYSLFVLAMNNLTKFDENDENSFKKFKQREGVKKIKNQAAKTIAVFLYFDYYHKKKMNLIKLTKTVEFRALHFQEQQDTVKKIKDINSTKYLFLMLFQVRFFHQRRMVYMHKDEDTEKLLQSMEFYIYMSQNEQSFILSKLEDIEIIVNDIMSQRNYLKTCMVKSKSLSYQLNNFARLLTEFGPSYHLENSDAINNSGLMSLEEMNTFVVNKIEFEKQNGKNQIKTLAIQNEKSQFARTQGQDQNQDSIVYSESIESVQINSHSNSTLQVDSQQLKSLQIRPNIKGSSIHNIFAVTDNPYFQNNQQHQQLHIQVQQMNYDSSSKNLDSNRTSQEPNYGNIQQQQRQLFEPGQWRQSLGIRSTNGGAPYQSFTNNSISEVSEETTSEVHNEEEKDQMQDQDEESKTSTIGNQDQNDESLADSNDQDSDSVNNINNDNSSSSTSSVSSANTDDEVTENNSSKRTEFEIGNSGMRLEHHHRSSYEDSSADQTSNRQSTSNNEESQRNQGSNKNNYKDSHDSEAQVDEGQKNNSESGTDSEDDNNLADTHSHLNNHITKSNLKSDDFKISQSSNASPSQKPHHFQSSPVKIGQIKSSNRANSLTKSRGTNRYNHSDSYSDSS